VMDDDDLLAKLSPKTISWHRQLWLFQVYVGLLTTSWQ